jgi:ribosomal protein S18 acetylase RimI-like enzyme
MEASQKPIEVRRAHPPDADAFAEFMRAAWREAGPDAPGFAGATDAVIDEITQTDAVVERMTGSDRTMHLAWLGDRVVGFSAMRRIDDDRIELAGIIVNRDSAGRGVGRSLVAASLEEAVSDGFSTAIVRTECDNDVAQAFYERLGFSNPVITIEWVGDVPVEVVELSRALP